MTERPSERSTHIVGIDQALRAITWQTQKRWLHMLSRPSIMLTLPQMMTLFAIDAAGTCRMSELADVTQQSAGTLTGIVDRLIDYGLVARVRDAEDRRVVQVTLTPLGSERLDQVAQTRYADMARVLQQFSLEHICLLDGLLQRLLAGLGELPAYELADIGEERASARPTS